MYNLLPAVVVIGVLRIKYLPNPILQNLRTNFMMFFCGLLKNINYTSDHFDAIYLG